MDPPCTQCRGACCRGWPYIVLSGREEASRFPTAVYVERAKEHRLPCPDGRCIYLAEDNKCSIYEDRPQACREFSCLWAYGLYRNRHGQFLVDNPDVARLIEIELPAFAERKREEAKNRPIF